MTEVYTGAAMAALTASSARGLGYSARGVVEARNFVDFAFAGFDLGANVSGAVAP